MINNEDRVLAIAPFTGGLGYAVIEWPLSLVAWGVKNTPAKQQNKVVTNIASLIAHYQPTTIALEDGGTKRTRRAAHLKSLMRQINRRAATTNIKVRTFSRPNVRDAFGLSSGATKHDLAVGVATKLPELVPMLPAPRRCGHNENYYMPMFTATAIALTYLYHRRH